MKSPGPTRHFAGPFDPNSRTSKRSQWRSSFASWVQLPSLKFPFREPAGAPGLNPPCKRQRVRPRIAGHWHGAPARVFAPHRSAPRRFRSRVSTLWSMGLISRFCYPRLDPRQLVPHRDSRRCPGDDGRTRASRTAASMTSAIMRKRSFCLLRMDLMAPAENSSPINASARRSRPGRCRDRKWNCVCCS